MSERPESYLVAPRPHVSVRRDLRSTGIARGHGLTAAFRGGAGLVRELTVRELRAKVREAKGRATEDEFADEDDPGAVVSFRGPISAALLWDLTIDKARRVIGSDAPVHVCVEAILAEALPGLPDPDRILGEALPDETPAGESCDHAGRPMERPLDPAGGPLGPDAFEALPPIPMVPLEALERARRDLVEASELLEDVAGLLCEGRPAGTGAIEPGGAAGHMAPREAFLQVKQIQRLLRPLRAWTARLVRDLRDIHGFRCFGYRSFAEFAALELRMSVRSAQRLRAEADLFQDRPELEQAYGAGQIGICSAQLIDGIATRAAKPRSGCSGRPAAGRTDRPRS